MTLQAAFGTIKLVVCGTRMKCNSGKWRFCVAAVVITAALAVVSAQEFTITGMSYSNGMVTLAWDMPTNKFIIDRSFTPPTWTNTAWCPFFSTGVTANSATFPEPDIDGRFFRVELGLEPATNGWDENLWPEVVVEMGPKRSPTNYYYDVEFAAITSITAPNDGVTDLSGLEYCTGLESLDLSANPFSDLTAISNLTGLTSLEISETLCTDISPLAALTNLEDLWAANIGITNIGALFWMRSLNRVDLYFNDFVNIGALTYCTNLTYLDLSYNYDVVDIKPLVDNAQAGGFGSGDIIDLRGNMSMNAASTTRVNILRVTYDVTVLTDF